MSVKEWGWASLGAEDGEMILARGLVAGPRGDPPEQLTRNILGGSAQVPR